MDTLNFETGGFPMSTERLASMQQCWKTINEALVAITGGDREDCYVVSGCGVLKYDSNNDAYFDGSTDGFIVVRGELLPFKAGGRGDYVVVESATAEQLAYQDGKTKTFRTSRYATLGLTPDSNNLTIYDFDPDNGRRSFSTLWEIAARKTFLDAAFNRIVKLENALAALDTSTGANLTALQRQLVPKGTIVMTAQTLPLSATSTDAVVSGMGEYFGYIPCGEWRSTQTVCQAWNGYFERIGLPNTARLVSSQAYLDFPWIAGKIGVKCPNLSGRFALGASATYTLGKTGGEEKHALTLREMPRHNHSINLDSTSKKGDSSSCVGTTQNTDLTFNTNYTGGSGTGNYSGNGDAHNNMPPYYALNYLVKVI